MAIGVVDLVWKRANLEGSSLLVLLALSDWADDDGESCFPKIKQISLKARIDRRTVFRILKRLEAENYLARKTDRGFGHRNEYFINIRFLESLPEKYHERKRKGGIVSPFSAEEKVTSTTPERCHPCHPKGDICDIPIRKNRHRTVIKNRHVTTPTYLEEREQMNRILSGASK